MLDRVLNFLKDRLNSYLRVKTGADAFDVVFVRERTQKEITFPKEALSLILVNIEEEQTFRSGAAYERRGNGQLSVNSTTPPYLYLNLYILVAANFSDYSQSLKLLSLIVSYFHSYRLFDRQNFPTLSSGIEKLTLELVSLPFAEQRDIWNLLGNPYLPSVLYKVRMIAFENLDALEVGADVIKTDEFASLL